MYFSTVLYVVVHAALIYWISKFCQGNATFHNLKPTSAKYMIRNKFVSTDYAIYSIYIWYIANKIVLC